MRPLQITLFLIANVIFLSQAGRNVHQLIFGTEPSVLDEFEPERQKARSMAEIQTLVDGYKSVSEEIRVLKESEDDSEVANLRKNISELQQKQHELRSEIQTRETISREVRDLWIFAGYGSLLICVGASLYRGGIVWPGCALLITGFCVLEFWASPSFFGGGAAAETHQLLLSRTIITFLALALVHILWTWRGKWPATTGCI